MLFYNKNFKSRKSQVAMEFLSTYGWALLAMLVAIGALVYFRVFDVSMLLPEKCTLSNNIGCEDFKLNQNSAFLFLRNNNPNTINMTSINVTSVDNFGSTVSCKYQIFAPNPTEFLDLPTMINRGDAATVNCTFSSNVYPVGSKWKSKITIAFKKDKPGAFGEVSEGYLYAKVS